MSDPTRQTIEHVARSLDLDWRRTCTYQPDAGHEVTWHTLVRQAEVAVAAVKEMGENTTDDAMSFAKEMIAGGTALREAVVSAIDRRYGFTCEFSSCPAQHRQEYDDLEESMRDCGYE